MIFCLCHHVGHSTNNAVQEHEYYSNPIVSLRAFAVLSNICSCLRANASARPEVPDQTPQSRLN
jgi:hypothetical protein